MSEAEKYDFWMNLPQNAFEFSLGEKRELLKYLDTNVEDDLDLQFILENIIEENWLSTMFCEEDLTKIIRNERFERLMPILVGSIEDEKQRIEYLCYVPDYENRLKLIEQLSLDGKLTLVSTRATKESIDLVMDTLKSEKERLDFILAGIMSHAVDCPFLVEYLNEDASILTVLRTLESNGNSYDARCKVATFIKDDCTFLEYLNTINILSFACIYERVKKIQQDSVLIEFIRRTLNEKFKTLLSICLSDEKKREECLSGFHSNTLFNMAQDVQNDDFSLEVIKILTHDYYKTETAINLKSDTYKEKALVYIYKSDFKVAVLITLKSDELKKRYLLDESLSLHDRLRLATYVKDKDARQEFVRRYYPIADASIYEFRYDNKYRHYNAGEDVLPEEITFGIEIEASGEMANAILAYGDPLLGRYTVDFEDSVTDGVEFSSDILRYNNADLDTIYRVCDFSKKNGLYATTECGGHIHFGSNYLNNYDSWFWLYYIYCNVERILYLISNEQGELPRDYIDMFAEPFSDKYVSILPKILEVDSPEIFIELIQEKTSSKTEGINIENIGKKQDTIEFRIPNGTLDPNTIVQNILLFGNLLVLARKLSYLPLDENTYRLLMAFDKSRTDEEDRLEILLKLLFKDEGNREVFRLRYRVNSKKLTEEKDEVLNLDFEQIALEETGIHI